MSPRARGLLPSGTCSVTEDWSVCRDWDRTQRARPCSHSPTEASTSPCTQPLRSLGLLRTRTDATGAGPLSPGEDRADPSTSAAVALPKLHLCPTPNVCHCIQPRARECMHKMQTTLRKRQPNVTVSGQQSPVRLRHRRAAWKEEREAVGEPAAGRASPRVPPKGYLRPSGQLQALGSRVSFAQFASQKGSPRTSAEQRFCQLQGWAARWAGHHLPLGAHA